MKKLPIYFLAAGMFAFVSCDSSTSTTTEEGRVIDADTISTQYEVERTVVETDTMTNTETIETEENTNR